MFVIKRNGKKETLKQEKILKRLQIMNAGLKISEKEIEYFSKQVFNDCYDGISSQNVDKKIVDILEENINGNKEIDTLAARISVSILHSETSKKFSSSMKKLYANNRLNKEEYKFIKEHKEILNEAVISDRDFDFNLETFRILSAGLESANGKRLERIQYYILRQTLKDCRGDIDQAIQEYRRLSCDQHLLLSSLLTHV